MRQEIIFRYITALGCSLMWWRKRITNKLQPSLTSTTTLARQTVFRSIDKETITNAYWYHWRWRSGLSRRRHGSAATATLMNSDRSMLEKCSCKILSDIWYYVKYIQEPVSTRLFLYCRCRIPNCCFQSSSPFLIGHR
jgi:hypothetical protein